MTKTKSIKKLLITFCIALFAFCISLVGATTVFAADGDVNYLYCDANGANWQTGTKAAGEYTPVTSSDTAWGTSGSEAWYVASGNIEIGSRVTVNGTVNLILADDANLTINGGIAVNSENTLIIWGQSNGTGKLTANGGWWVAGIGGDMGSSGGVITINGGTITATGEWWGAGIGGGKQGSGGVITINGGTVTATSGQWGAGIGGGEQGSGGTITIGGGTVTATSGQWSAGIGGGGDASSNGTLSSGENGSAIVQASSINADATSFVDYIEKSGASYTVHGNVTISADFTIAEGETLTVPEGATLTVPGGVTLTNNGTIVNNGTFVNNGTLICNNHNYENGVCTICKGYEAAKPVSDTHHAELNETHNGYYAIENAGQLYWFAQEVNGGNKSINAVLTENIIINEKVLDDDGSLVDDTAALRVWTPIGDAYFCGIFDGDGHTISGLYEGVLFYALGEGGTVKNVGVTNSYMIGSSYAAGIAFMNFGIVENCWSDATVQTTGYYSGGLVGNNEGIISNCYNLGTTIGGTCVGAIAGLNETNASVINCYFISEHFSGAVGLNNGSVDELTCGMTNAQFASGEVAYLLNGDQTTIVWGQTIGTDTYPVFKTADNTVYYRAECNGTTMVYSNLEKPTTHDTSITAADYFNTDGTCKACGAQAAASVLAGEATYYFTDLQTALSSDAAKSGTADAPATVTLLSDASAASGFSIYSAHIILDLNGFNVNCTNEYGIAISVTYGGITIRGNGTVTGCYVLHSAIAIVRVEGGTLDGTSYGICTSGGELHISGGTVKGGSVAIDYASLNAFTISGGTFYGMLFDNTYGGSAVQPVITGGSFPEGIVLGDECPALSALLGEGYCYSDADGKKVTLTDGQKEITGSVTVKKDIFGATVTVEDITLTYDGTAKEPEVSVQLSDDTLSKGVDYEIVYSNNINAGTATVTVIGIGAYAGQVEATFTVNKKAITVTADDKSICVDGTYEFTFTVEGLIGDDTLTVNPEFETNANVTTAGVYDITVSGADAGENYSITYVDGKLTVNAHSWVYTAVEHIIYEKCSVCNTDGGVLELGWNTDNHVYDGNDKRVNIQKETLVGKEIWDVDYRIDNSLTAVQITDAGTYTATAAVGGAKATMTFEILKATPSYTAPTGLTATYGDTLACVQLPHGFSWHDADTTLVGNAGNNTFLVTFTPEDTKNYNVVTDIEVTVAVGKKSVTVTAENKEVEQFTALPEFTYTVDGMLDGDEFTTAPVAGVTITDTKTVGEYEITVSGGENSNYEFNYVGAKLTVTEHTEHRDGTATCTNKAVCGICGAEYGEPLGHTDETVNGKAATCTEAGLTDGKKCSVCDETLTAQTEIAATGHTEETVNGKAATCTEAGLTDGKKCSVCDETLTAQTEIAATGHTEETVNGKAATCTEAGLTDGVKCSVCDETLTAQTEITATGHAYDNACDTTCNTCGEERTPAEHIDADENNACDECGAELPKDGLSGGAIAGIAVGSTAVVGGGGFALFWFVFRKKRRI